MYLFLYLFLHFFLHFFFFMRSSRHWKSLICKIWKKSMRVGRQFIFIFIFNFIFIFINIWGSFPFFFPSKIQLTKPTKIFGNFFYTDYRTLGKKKSTRKKHILPFFENPRGKFIEFDKFYYLDTFSLVDFWWILIFVKTENIPDRKSVV